MNNRTTPTYYSIPQAPMPVQHRRYEVVGNIVGIEKYTNVVKRVGALEKEVEVATRAACQAQQKAKGMAADRDSLRDQNKVLLLELQSLRDKNKTLEVGKKEQEQRIKELKARVNELEESEVRMARRFYALKGKRGREEEDQAGTKKKQKV